MTAAPTPTIPPFTYKDSTTSFHPFTTPWSEPPECSKLFMAVQTTPSFALTAFMPEWGQSIKGGEKCLPPEFTQYTSSNNAKTQHYLGPFRCPGNWTEATTEVLSSSFTHTYCCPSGYGNLLNQANDPRPGIWGKCISSVNIYDEFTWAYKENDKWTVTTNGSHETTTAKTGVVSYRTVIAYPYVGGYNTAPLTGTAVPTTSSSDQSGLGLSTGAKAGIGVGVSLGVIVFVVLVGLFYFIGRRRRRDDSLNSEINQAGDSDKDAGKPQELSGSEPSKLDPKTGQVLMPSELQSRGDAPELQGDEGLRLELEGGSEQPPVELEASTSYPGGKVMGKDDTKSYQEGKEDAETRGDVDRQMKEDSNERDPKQDSSQ